MPPTPSGAPPGALRITAAFAAIYLLWGSTYLALKFGVRDLPPFLFIAIRSLLAGPILYAWARARGAPRPTATEWGHAAVVGALLFVGGQSVLAWSQRRVPSGVSALIIATIPLWMTLLSALRESRALLTLRVAAGLALGLAGIALLAGPGVIFSDDPVDRIGIAALLGAALSWTVGSIRSREAPLPASTALSAGMSLIAGGVILVGVGLVLGERIGPESLTSRAALSIAYLVVFGSLTAFASYIWLMRVSSPSRVATYAFVNPVVALLLGWAFAGEALGPRTLVAAGLMVSGVALIVLAPGPVASPPAPAAPPLARKEST